MRARDQGRMDERSPAANGCDVCRLVRRFLLAVAVLAVVYLTSPGWQLPEGFDYGAMVGDAFLFSFLALLIYRFRQFRKQQATRSPKADGLTWLGTSRPVARRRPGP